MLVNTKYLKLPFSFDVERLQQDLEKINESEWIDHMNTAAYDKKWCCVPLYAHEGKSDGIYAMETDGSFEPTEILQRCDYLKEVIDSFQCEKVAVRLMLLQAGDEIKQHTDHDSALESGVLRIHVPIQTNPEVLFTVGGESVHFTQGNTWYLNADLSHGVQNPSNSDRIHLLIDCKVNKWFEDVMVKAGYVYDSKPKYGDQSITDDNIQEIIATLEQMGTEGGSKAAEDLRVIHASAAV